jgi:hypothetical protein
MTRIAHAAKLGNCAAEGGNENRRRAPTLPTGHAVFNPEAPIR